VFDECVQTGGSGVGHTPVLALCSQKSFELFNNLDVRLYCLFTQLSFKTIVSEPFFIQDFSLPFCSNTQPDIYFLPIDQFTCRSNLARDAAETSIGCMNKKLSFFSTFSSNRSRGAILMVLLQTEKHVPTSSFPH
jgi:hypothetical protein